LIEPISSVVADSGVVEHLPTTARRRVDPNDVVAPPGYRVEAVAIGLSMPCGMAIAPDGTVFIAEGGTTWPTRPWMPPRILRLETSGAVQVLAQLEEGGPRGLAFHDGQLYAMAKGGYTTRLLRFDPVTGEKTVLVDKLPDGGWHEPGGPVFDSDGNIYFAQGSVSQQGVIEPSGFTVDVARHPHAHDVPGQDVTLTGNNVWSFDPVIPYNDTTPTGAFKPYGVPAEKGEVIKGEFWCSTGVYRARPDGSEPEMLAWGIRNPYGLALNEAGELYISDNDFEEKGNRAVGEDPDRVWHVKNASKPFGSVSTPEWFGFPDYSGLGLPLWDERHKPNRGTQAKQLIENPPPLSGPAAALFEPHTCLTMMDFSRSDIFGHRGKLFLTQWGTLAPLNTTRPEAFKRGFQVALVDVETGTSEPFLRNKQRGPAGAIPGSGGLERPVDCKFHPDGKSLYVLDFGSVDIKRNTMVAYAHTGVLWRVTRDDA
jgi:glucose/arabinose dehydrogenase